MPDRLAVRGDRLVELPLRSEGDAEVDVGARAVGPEGDGHREAADRVLGSGWVGVLVGHARGRG